MKEEIRRAVAATAFKMVRGTHPSSLYSYAEAKYTGMSGGYDYGVSAHYSDNYHYGNVSHYSVIANDNQFSGYDYSQGHHFSGTINGNSITLFDYGEGRYYQYSA